MLAILKSKIDPRLAFFEFGERLLPPQDPEARMRWILADYNTRRDDQWEIPPHQGSEILGRLLNEQQSDAGRLLPVVRALGWYSLPEYSPMLWRVTEHSDPAVRRAALGSLGQMGSFDSAAVLRRHLDAEDEAMATEAARALLKLGSPQFLPEVERQEARNPALSPTLIQARRRIKAVESGNTGAFLEAGIAAEDYEDLVFVAGLEWKIIVGMLTDRARSEMIRTRAARLLGLARVRRSARMLQSVLEDAGEARGLRVACATALGHLRAWRAIQSLVELLDGPEPELQDAAVRSLGRIGRPEALQPLLDHWDTRDGALREELRLALRGVCTVSGAEWARELLRSQVPVFVEASYFIDAKLELHHGFPRPLVSQLLVSAEPDARRDAILLASILGNDSDADLLGRMSREDGDETNRELAKLGSERLRRAPGR